MSNEIRADRNVTDLIRRAKRGGPINFELSYGTFDAFLESVMFGAWATNVLKTLQTQKAFTLEKTFEAGATDQYHRFTDAPQTQCRLQSKPPNRDRKFRFPAKGSSVGQAIISGATYVAANANPVINAASNFGSLAVTGASESN